MSVGKGSDDHHYIFADLDDLVRRPPMDRDAVAAPDIFGSPEAPEPSLPPEGGGEEKGVVGWISVVGIVLLLSLLCCLDGYSH